MGTANVIADRATSRHFPGDELDYLCIERFIRDLAGARALAAAFQSGLIDRLEREGTVPRESLADHAGGDAWGLRFLCDLLRGNEVIEDEAGSISLTTQFRDALRFRDLLQAKLDFATFAAHDFLDYFSLLLSKPEELLRRADMFKLFRYDRCFEQSSENVQLTQRWMRYTTALTKYEARVCLRRHDFTHYRRMLDIGGNSGEFCLQICKAHPEIEATVFDLPVVCEIGREHVHAEPEVARIAFRHGNALVEPLPGNCDLITFKSMLHDWPDGAAQQLLTRAAEALPPGGSLLIFERSELTFRGELPAFSLLPMLLFARTYRRPEFYTRQLEALGFRVNSAEVFQLEMPFLLVIATKPS
ncbi:methyltransferase [Verrucomicrobiota bacterium sgz303538]